MKLTCVLVMGILLVGCSAQQHEDPAKAAEAAVENAQRAEAQDQADEAHCRGYGLSPGSDGYAQCVRVLKNGHVNEDLEDK